jgi:hypothetical protein
VDAPVIVAVIAATAAIVGPILTYRAASRATRSSSMLEWTRQLQASEAAARKEAEQSRVRAEAIKKQAETDVGELRSEMAGLHEQIREVRRLAETLTDQLTMVRVEVWRPEPDVEALRRLVGRPSPLGWPDRNAS